MKYMFYGDKLRLVKYEIEITTKFGDESRTYTETAATDEERDDILKRFPDATVTPIDNTGYEWLDGKIFTQSELWAGELEKAISLGEEAYEQQKLDADPEYRMEILEEALMELAGMIGGE